MTSTPQTPQPDEPHDTNTVSLNKPSGPGTGGSVPPPPPPGPGQPGAVPPPGHQAPPGPPPAGPAYGPGHPPQGGPGPQGFAGPGQQGYGAPGQYPPGYGASLSPSDERLWATLSHAAGPVAVLVSGGTLGWAVPLIVYLVFKDRSRFVREQAAEALNFHITLVISYLVLFVLTLITFGFAAFLFLAPLVLSIVFGIMAAVATGRGQSYRYPINIRLVR